MAKERLFDYQENLIGHELISRAIDQKIDLLLEKSKSLKVGSPEYLETRDALESENIKRSLQVTDSNLLRPQFDNYNIWGCMTRPPCTMKKYDDDGNKVDEIDLSQFKDIIIISGSERTYEFSVQDKAGNNILTYQLDNTQLPNIVNQEYDYFVKSQSAINKSGIIDAVFKVQTRVNGNIDQDYSYEYEFQLDLDN